MPWGEAARLFWPKITFPTTRAPVQRKYYDLAKHPTGAEPAGAQGIAKLIARKKKLITGYSYAP